MDFDILQRHFARIGAELQINFTRPLPDRAPRWLRQPVVRDFSLDIADAPSTRKLREHFTLTINAALRERLEFVPVDVQPAQRHLVLLAKNHAPDSEKPKQHFLCGHDERHWFVASVTAVSTVRDALESLKPQPVRIAQHSKALRGKEFHSRHNAAFIRQGEWFFLPAPEFTPTDPHAILHNEPIRRSGSQAHWIEYVYRRGGTTVHVCNRFPNGLTGAEYRALIKTHPAATKWGWRIMQREPEVFARGKVRHRDHKTLELQGWHRVVMNAEARNENVAFLD